MIDYNEAVAVTREQLALAERLLESLRRSVTNPRNFAVFSEGYVDQIARLKADLRKYTAAAKRQAGKAKKPATGKRCSASKSSSSPRLETFGGPIHQFESDFRDEAKPRSRGKQKSKTTRRPRKAG